MPPRLSARQFAKSPSGANKADVNMIVLQINRAAPCEGRQPRGWAAIMELGGDHGAWPQQGAYMGHFLLLL